MISESGSTYTCKHAFSHMKLNKSKFHSKNLHLNDAMQTDISRKLNRILILFKSKVRPKIHNSKLCSRHLHCNVQFCVGYRTNCGFALLSTLEIFECTDPQHIISFSVADLHFLVELPLP